MIRKSPHPQLGDLDMADLSAAAQVPLGTEGAELGDWDRFEDVDLGSGFKAALFRQKGGDEHVLAFALDRDAQASGPYPYRQAAALAQSCRSRFGNKLMLTRHWGCWQKKKQLWNKAKPIHSRNQMRKAPKQLPM